MNKGKWIKATEAKDDACYEFYKDFSAEKKIKNALLKITAMGMYRAFLNGKRVGNELFTPYWTEYDKHIQYQCYDVTEMLEARNVIEVICAEGWAVGFVRAGAEYRRHYADNIALRFVLEIEYDDGSCEYIVSDEDVKVRISHIIKSSIYNGETADKTAVRTELGCAEEDTAIQTEIIEQIGEKVTEQEEIRPRKLIVTPSGERVIDFGQNLAGYVEVRANGKRGDKIVLSHAEVLDGDGNFYTENLRSAEQKNTYVLDGSGNEVFKPMFSWQGFRYVRVDEYPDSNIDLANFKAIVVHSDIKRIGDFVCGSQKLNQLYHNIIWGQKSNYVDVPTDCPQRDERLGWTGDAQVFVRAAAINFDVERFFEKWLTDLRAVQEADGGVGWLVPSCNLHYPENISSGWGDAAVICPWEIYMAYGNKHMLEVQFESMRRWVEYIRNFGEEEYLWLGGKQFGDWLGMDNEDGSLNGATSFDYVSSAYYARSTELLIKAGKAIGKNIDDYEDLYGNIVKAFKNRFTENGMPIEKTQTAYAIALYFGLCDDREKTAYVLNEMIRENGTRLSTGFIGTPYLLHALSENGYEDTAFDLLLQEKFPSWLFSVNQGATTMWEHWDGLKKDGSFWDKKMNSFNHYAYGAVYDWIFGVAAGIKVMEDGAGYRHIKIKPSPDRRIGFIKAHTETRTGIVSSYWYYCENCINFEFEIPEGTVAEIELPDGKCETVTRGKYLYSISI